MLATVPVKNTSRWKRAVAVTWTITVVACSSLFPSLVWSGDELGVAWYDERDRNEIYAAFFGCE